LRDIATVIGCLKNNPAAATMRLCSNIVPARYCRAAYFIGVSGIIP